MKWLLDTNVAIQLRDSDHVTLDRLEALDGPLMLSVVSRIELEGGVHQIPAEAAQRRERLDVLLETITVLDFGRGSAEAYRTIIEAVGFSPRKVLDRMIAAQAIAHDATLITRNGDDFRDLPGLQLVMW